MWKSVIEQPKEIGDYLVHQCRECGFTRPIVASWSIHTLTGQGFWSVQKVSWWMEIPELPPLERRASGIQVRRH